MQPEANGPRLISDEEIQRVRLDKVTPHDAPITLADYDQGWPTLFAREAARIRAALGGRAVQIEHVGSTSVPGPAAKPIVDILLAVPDSSDEPAYVPALAAAGYVLRIREPDWFEHRLFKGPGTDINLHVFTAGAAEIDVRCQRACSYLTGIATGDLEGRGSADMSGLALSRTPAGSGRSPNSARGWSADQCSSRTSFVRPRWRIGEVTDCGRCRPPAATWPSCWRISAVTAGHPLSARPGTGPPKPEAV
jgi:hypothetical protein